MSGEGGMDWLDGCVPLLGVGARFLGPATCSARSMTVDGAAVDWPLTLARIRWPTRLLEMPH